jgi:hypothetical protein
MPEEKREDELRPDPEAKKPYVPPALVEYGTVRELTAGKTAIAADGLPGSRH